jgi:hypothetical protein
MEIIYKEQSYRIMGSRFEVFKPCSWGGPAVTLQGPLYGWSLKGLGSAGLGC